jgi:hypothetical protein
MRGNCIGRDELFFRNRAPDNTPVIIEDKGCFIVFKSPGHATMTPTASCTTFEAALAARRLMEL